MERLVSILRSILLRTIRPQKKQNKIKAFGLSASFSLLMQPAMNRIAAQQLLSAVLKRTESLQRAVSVQKNNILTCSFHFSSRAGFATVKSDGAASTSRPRRRRRGDSGGVSAAAPSILEDDSADAAAGPRYQAPRPLGVTDAKQFINNAEAYLDKIETAVKPMIPLNDIFVVKRTRRGNGEGGRLVIQLAPGLGLFSFEVDEDSQHMYFQAPSSGRYNYVLSVQTGDWVCKEDGHMLEGMFVRDLIRVCNGLPDL